MKNSYKKVWAALFWLATLTFIISSAGCARVGYDFDTKNVQNIKIGETTQKDVIDMFGQPWREGVEDGVTMWTYGRYTYRLIGDAGTKDLVIKFNNKNIVSSYTFNKTMDTK